MILCVVGAAWQLLPEGSSESTAVQESSFSVPEGRIAYEGEDGNIWSVDPQGDDLVAHSEDASPGERRYRFPTWSPDGATLAFVELTTVEDTLESAIHLHGPEGEQRLPTDAPPIYLHWTPDGNALAYLASNGGSLTLELLEPDTEQTTTLGEGTPFYFSWRPDGEQLLAHIGLTMLTFVERDGAQRALEAQGGLFQAPDWSQDGSRLAYVSADEEGRFRLQKSDAEAGGAETIAESGSIFSLGWSPDSQRLAYSSMTQQVPLAAYGPLWVHDVAGGEDVQLSEGPVVGFFWSPDGTKLAYLQPEVTAPTTPQEATTRSQQEEDTLWLRWYVWDGEQSRALGRFAPSRPFSNDYLQYFDQYAQSISLWSPQSDALLYSGRDESGREGTWVMPIEGEGAEEWIGPGVLAAWSLGSDGK